MRNSGRDTQKEREARVRKSGRTRVRNLEIDGNKPGRKQVETEGVGDGEKETGTHRKRPRQTDGQ